MTRAPLPNIVRDERGATAAIFALLGAVVLGTTGIALDTGLYFSQTSALQSVTEAATLSAAAAPNIADAETRARAFFVRNGYPASAVASVTLGRYCADKDRAPNARFLTAAAGWGNCAGNGLRTAVRVHAAVPSKSYLVSALGGGSLIPPLASTATAARIDEAGLGFTTGVVALDPGLVNSLLSLLAGRNISLSTSQLQVLLASNIDAGLMFDKLAARVGETGSYGDLVRRNVPLADLLNASAAAAPPSDTSLISALLALATQIGGGVQVPLTGLFDLGVWEKMPVGNAGHQTGLRAGLNSYQLITYALQSNGRAANLSGLSVGVTGVAAIKLAAMVEGPVSRARFAFGPQGETSVGTTAVRLLLKVQILDPGALLGGLGLPVAGAPAVDLPLLIQVGEGTASVDSITCGQDASTDTRVSVTAHSGLLDVFLGTMPNDVLAPARRPVKPSDIEPVDLINLLGLVRVQLRTTAGQVTAATATPVFVQRGGTGGAGFIGSPPAAGTAATIGNRLALADTLRTLKVEPTVCLKVLFIETCVSTGGLVNSVGQLVAAPIAALGVDPLLDSLLKALGLQLGYANVWVTGARCGVPVLV